jgi:L-ascorbate metabolism protein UlaG (beta-lactamase superfamily)
MKCSFVTLGITLLGIAAASAAEKKLELRYLGQSFFVLTTSAGTKVAFDPHAIDQLGRPSAAADLVLISHPHPDHMQLGAIENKGKAKVLEGIKLLPPAVEGGPPRATWNAIDETFRDVTVRNIGTFHDMVQGLSRGRNSVFVVEADGLKIVHLGDLGHLLSDDQIRQIGPVDVLLIPVGGVYTLNGTRAKEVIAQLKPRRMIVPMHYGVGSWEDVLPVTEFLDGMGNVQRTPSTNLITIDPAAAPPKEPVVIVPGYGKK